ncbi:MAG: hypothetical protein KA821_05060 [Chitinophagaceae bacterium]|nr:hypothetical protein [Chitinophagaceae bacterium]
MNVDLERYRIISTIFLGTSLRISFQHSDNAADIKILELKDVAGFIENNPKQKPIFVLAINEKGGSYNLDLSLRLRNPAINDFPEVFIFVDPGCTDFCFRAVAKFIDFREWTEKDKWLP